MGKEENVTPGSLLRQQAAKARAAREQAAKGGRLKATIPQAASELGQATKAMPDSIQVEPYQPVYSSQNLDRGSGQSASMESNPQAAKSKPAKPSDIAKDKTPSRLNQERGEQSHSR